MKDTIKSVEEIGYLDDEFFALEYDKEALDEQIKKESLENALKDGIEKGSHEEKISFAKELLKEDMPLEKIIRLTKLNKEEIEELGYSSDEYLIEYDKEALDEQIKKESLENALKDGIEKGMKDGIEKGIEQGSQNEKITIAKNLLKLNISIEDISKSTGLSIEEIEKL
jgi:hypothetical protein